MQGVGAGKDGGEKAWVDYAMGRAAEERGVSVPEYSPNMTLARSRAAEEKDKEGEEEANNLSTLVDGTQDEGMLGRRSGTSDVGGIRHASGANALSWTGLPDSTAGPEQNDKPGAARFKARPVVKPQRPTQVMGLSP